jgi:hypothetical protein
MSGEYKAEESCVQLAVLQQGACKVPTETLQDVRF